MFIPRRLQIVSSQGVFEFALPFAGQLFEATQFFRVPGAEANDVFPTIGDAARLTIVINPDDYSVRELRSISGTVVLWFMRKMVSPPTSRFSDVEGLVAAGEEKIKSRKDFLHELICSPNNYRYVVSDCDTRDFLMTRSLQATISPPPINLVAVREKVRPNLTSRILTASDGGDYSQVFLSSLPTDWASLDYGDKNWQESFFGASHVVDIGDSVFPHLTYESTLSIAAGKTLISTALEPLWGLEPGLDFIEVATPEELSRVSETILRNPPFTRLMATRAAQKAKVFDSQRVMKRLFLD